MLDQSAQFLRQAFRERRIQVVQVLLKLLEYADAVCLRPAGHDHFVETHAKGVDIHGRRKRLFAAQLHLRRHVERFPDSGRRGDRLDPDGPRDPEVDELRVRLAFDQDVVAAQIPMNEAPDLLRRLAAAARFADSEVFETMGIG